MRQTFLPAIATAIAVKVARLRGGNSIWVYDMTTKRRRQLIARAFGPAFSPDGRRIAYVRAVTKTNTEIVVARVAGSGERKITANPSADVDPSWQPAR